MATAISYFNPCANFNSFEEFKCLKSGDKITVVVLTFFATFFFLIGGVVAFRWGVRHYNRDSNRAIKTHAVAVPHVGHGGDERIREAEAQIAVDQQKLDKQTAEERRKVVEDLYKWQEDLGNRLERDLVSTT